jgi:hypothetical protein
MDMADARLFGAQRLSCPISYVTRTLGMGEVNEGWAKSIQIVSVTGYALR